MKDPALPHGGGGDIALSQRGDTGWPEVVLGSPSWGEDLNAHDSSLPILDWCFDPQYRRRPAAYTTIDPTFRYAVFSLGRYGAAYTGRRTTPVTGSAVGLRPEPRLDGRMMKSLAANPRQNPPGRDSHGSDSPLKLFFAWATDCSGNPEGRGGVVGGDAWCTHYGSSAIRAAQRDGQCVDAIPVDGGVGEFDRAGAVPKLAQVDPTEVESSLACSVEDSKGVES